jgi:hypothetical protein
MQSNPLDVTVFLRNHQELSAIAQEDLIDLQMSIMDEPEAHEHVTKCYSYLHLNGQNLSQLLCHSIPLKVFEDRFVQISNERRNGERYITCLKVYLASKDEASTVFPVYQPIYLKWMRYDAVMQKDQYEIPTYGYGKYYIFDGSKFDNILDSEKDSLVNNYQSKIALIHTVSGTNYTSFDSIKDVESCLVPFQLIYKLMHETPSKEIFITNAMRELKSDLSSPMKHIIMVSGERVDETIPLVPAKYANRSHLCPPCTASFGFDLA